MATASDVVERGMDRDCISATGWQRAISGAELGVGIAVVVAHNVYHAIPNEVPILFLLALISFRLREGHWGTRLYAKPKSWLKTVLAAVGCFLALLAKDEVLEPMGQHFWPGPAHISSVISQAHDGRHALFMVLFVWAFAAFGEEVVYRGYLLRRAIDVFGPSRRGLAVALLISAAAFGWGHFYKGPVGILESTGSGLILGGAYLFSRRLWVSSLAHGLNDTVAIWFSYLGW